MWALLRLPRFGGATHANDHDNWSRHCEVGFPYLLAFFQKLPPCLVGIEACASHYWSRELQGLGHTVRLMPPAYVKPYVKRHKNDATDAEAICEAVTRPNMRFVATKTPEQQSGLVLHRTRHLFIRQQTAVINSIHAHLAEFTTSD
jgi:transposase